MAEFVPLVRHQCVFLYIQSADPFHRGGGEVGLTLSGCIEDL